jgi:hypothetical protein
VYEDQAVITRLTFTIVEMERAGDITIFTSSQEMDLRRERISALVNCVLKRASRARAALAFPEPVLLELT